jgi:hypothetical protein
LFQKKRNPINEKQIPASAGMTGVQGKRIKKYFYLIINELFFFN